MRKNVITLFVGILLLGIPMVYAGKPVKNMDLYLCIGQSNMARTRKTFSGGDGYDAECLFIKCRRPV